MLRDVEEVAGQPPWVMTFADMMTLLLTFFVLLVSMSELKKDDKFQNVADSLEVQFGSERGRIATGSDGEVRHAPLASIITAARTQRRELLGGELQAETLAQFTFATDATELTAEQRRQIETFPVAANDFLTFEIHAANQENFPQLLARVQSIRQALLDTWPVDGERIHVSLAAQADHSQADQPIRVLRPSAPRRAMPLLTSAGRR